MWHTFLELLLYSSLGASLLTYTDIAPDALFTVESAPAIAAVGEQIDTTLSIKTNTPIMRVDGTVQHTDTPLDLNMLYYHPQYRLATKAQSDSETVFSLESAGDAPVGALTLLTITHSAKELGTSTITFTNLSAKTVSDESTFLTTRLESEVLVADKKMPEPDSFIEVLLGFFTQR